MKKRYIALLVYFSCGFFYFNFAQNNEVKKSFNENPEVNTMVQKQNNLFMNIGYFGELLFHPGIKAGFDYFVAGNEIHKLF